MSLIERLRAREPTAFSEAYEAHRKSLYGFLCRLCADADLANDLFQDTWIQLVRYAPKLRDDSNLGAWLCVVARNQFRKHRRFVVVDEERLRSLRWIVAEPEAHKTDSLEQALAKLPLADREILLLHAQSDRAQDALVYLGVIFAIVFQR